jgi:hypothetical protein
VGSEEEEDCEEEEDEEKEDDCMAEERDPIYEPSVARQRHLERQQQRRRQHMVLPPSRQCRELRQQLRDIQDFLTSSLVLHRQGAAVQPATLRSTLLLVRQYLWFCWQKRHIFKPTLAAFEDLERYVANLRWLLGERQLQPVSALNHMGAAASVYQVLATVRGVSQPQLRECGGDLLLAAIEETDPTHCAAVSAAHFGGVGPDATVASVGSGSMGVRSNSVMNVE